MPALGEAGLVKVVYTGYYEVQYYEGEATKTVYKFGLLRRVGYVDARDVAGLFALEEDSLPVFQLK